MIPECEPTDHKFKKIDATKWVVVEPTPEQPIVKEERQEIFCCKACGYVFGLMHSRPLGSTSKDKVGSWWAPE